MTNPNRDITENYVYIIDLDVFNLCNKHSDPSAQDCRIDKNYAREACESLNKIFSGKDWSKGLWKLVKVTQAYTAGSPRGYGAAIIFPNLGEAASSAKLAARCLERVQYICKTYPDELGFIGRVVSLLGEFVIKENTICLFNPRIKCRDLVNMVQRCYRGARHSDKCQRVISAIECIVDGLRNMYGRLRAGISVALFCDREGSLCSSIMEENGGVKYIELGSDVGPVCVVFADD